MTTDADSAAPHPAPVTAGLERPIRQLSGSEMFGIWAAATGPMAVASWLVAPRLAPSLGDLGLGKALILTLTAGLIWQFVLVVVLVVAEQRTLRWSALRDALWLNSPRSPTTGRRGGRLWWVLVPMTVIFAAELVVPAPPPWPETSEPSWARPPVKRG